MGKVMSILAASKPNLALVYNREYACHQAAAAASSTGRVLWADLAARSEPPMLRMLTEGEIAAPQGWTAKAQQPYVASDLQVGETLRFRIRINPTVRREGKRIPIWTARDCGRDQGALQWLNQRAERGGFEIEYAEVLETDVVKIKQAKASGARQITFVTALIQGKLKLADTVKFTKTLYAGLGPQRAFGCGLLLVKRLRQGN